MASVFQVVRGQQRNQEFFQTVMDYGEIADLVKLPEDVLGDQLFNKDLTMQRKVNWPRVKSDLVPYLENDDAFYSALTRHHRNRPDRHPRWRAGACGGADGQRPAARHLSLPHVPGRGLDRQANTGFQKNM
jgi:hypothetical protein